MSWSAKRIVGTVVVGAALTLAAALPACAPNPRTVGGAAVAVPAQQQVDAQAAANTAPMEITIETTEWKFLPKNPTVPVGTPLKITLKNTGVVEHDIKIAGYGFQLKANPGETKSATFVANKAGEFEFDCTIPGHKEAGMVGKLVVTGGAPAAQAAQSAAASVPAPKPTVAPAVNAPRLPQPKVAPPVNRQTSELVKVEIEVKEVTATLTDGVSYTFWTFGGTVPGPMIRVREGDTVEVILKNAPDSKVTHSIDLHSVTGPGGGAKATQIQPGGQAGFRFKATNPGTYVYHCATPMVAHHIANGMYGLIVVEPAEGLPKVDHEFYVMQGDFYLAGERGQQGHREFSLEKMLDERPDFVLFNGGVGAITGNDALRAKVGETVRIFFGVGGPNITSSFHVIGEIFDRVYPEGSSEAMTNVQTTLVPTGGSAVVEFKVEVPGTYILVDHSLGRLEKGGAALLEVEGPANPEIFEVLGVTTGQ